uniref:Si:ch211-285c6.6 n=1 Tax=Danio rerio TaxID=7955 RepID=A0A140LFU2_DANRE|nr:uncharacterized protein si:ch211-285c6.6 [Danio rerio]|eukprot:XP_005160448.1 uncharacterized protein si:ch211-285c6.6 [Danio rerio]
MASPRPRRRRNSMDLPTNLSSDLVHLNEELNRLNKDISPQCDQHMKNVLDHIDQFKNDSRIFINAFKGGAVAGIIAFVLSISSLFLNDDDDSVMAIAAGAALTVVSGLLVVFGKFQKKRKVKNLKRVIEEELKEFQDKITPLIDILETMCQRTEEIMSELLLKYQKAQVLRERLAFFDKMRLFQEVDFSKEGDQMSKMKHLSGNLSHMIAKVTSVSDIIKEITEERRRQYDKPVDATYKEVNVRDIKKQTEQMINEMKKTICQLRNIVKESSKITDRM